MYKRALVGCSALILLAACTPAAKRPYQEPQSGPTAYVTFRNATPGRTEIALFDDAASCTGRRHLPALLIDEQQSVRVPGGEPLAFSLRYVVPNTTPPRYCDVVASFETAPGGRYEVLITAGGNRPCTAQVRQLEGQQTQRSLQAVLRAPVSSRSEDGPFCLPLR